MSLGDVTLGVGMNETGNSSKFYFRIQELLENPKKFQGFQQQLLIILHVRQCMQYTGTELRTRQIEQLAVLCKFPPCQFMKNVFCHVLSCKDTDNCSYPHCFTTKQIIAHWMNCSHIDCILCSPIKQRFERSELTEDGVQIVAEPTTLKKIWQTTCVSFRDGLVTKIVKLIIPTVTQSSLSDSRYDTLIKFVKKIEKQTFDEAKDQAEYYRCLADQVQRTQTRLQDKFPNPMQTQQQQTQNTSPSSILAQKISFNGQIPIISLPKIAKIDSATNRCHSFSPTVVDLDNPKPSTSGVSTMSKAACVSDSVNVSLSQRVRLKRLAKRGEGKCS